MTELPVGKPEVTYGIYKNTFEWKDLSLAVNVERITDDGKAELYFYHINSDGKKLLHMGNANLLSSTMQREFKKSLSTRGLDVDWQTLLTYVARDTMEHLRQGEQIIMLDASFGKSPPAYLLSPLFVKNAANIIYADKSSAKSLFMTLIDITLSLPWYENPLGLNIAKDTRHTVLFLDWENDANITGWQKECIVRGMGLEWCDLPYLHCSRPLHDSIEHIRNKIMEISADVVIVDSLGMAVGDDLNLTKPAFAFYAALRQLPVTPLIIAHTSKDINNKRKTVYGNAYYENEARSVWEVSKQQISGDNQLTITLYHRKSPPFSGYHEPLAWRFTFEGDNTIVELDSPVIDGRGTTEERSVEDKIMGILMLSSKPMSATDILQRSRENKEPIKEGSIRTTLGRLVKKREPDIAKDLEGKYYYLP